MVVIPPPPQIRDRKSTPKNFGDKDFAELTGKLSGAICLKTLVLLGSALELFRNFFGTVRASFWVWCSFLAPHKSKKNCMLSFDDKGIRYIFAILVP